MIVLLIQSSQPVLKPSTMLSNTTLETINQMPYGLSQRGQYKLYKVRYALAVADVFMSKIPHEFKATVQRYVTKKGFVLIGIIDHRNSMIWQHAQIAQNCAAKAKREGVVGQLTLKFMGSHKDQNECDVFTYRKPD